MSGKSGGFLVVRTSQRLVGLPLAHVLEVVALGAVHPVPVVERAVRGVIAVQGRTIPLVHLAALLEGGECPQDAGAVGVIVAVGAHRVCLEVEEAEILVRTPALPVPPGETLPWAVGVARHDDTLVPLLDLPALSSRLMEAAST